MCELLALNANTPTDMGFSFRGLSRRGGASGEHADGWGLASFTTAKDVVTILSTEPLTTDEYWQPFQAGESLLFCAGDVVWRCLNGLRPVPKAASRQPAAAAPNPAHRS